MILETLKNLFSTLNRGHASFAGSSALVMLFPLVSLPIIARLYSPSDFGAYAVFFALATILSAISSFSMNNAIMLEPTADGCVRATLLTIALTFSFSILLYLVFLTLLSNMVTKEIGSQVADLLVWLPVTIFLSGGFQALYLWATKNQEYQLLARNKLILGASTMLLQIVIGTTKPGALGLVISNLIGLGLAFILLLTHFIRMTEYKNADFNISSVIQQCKLYYRLPLWTLPATLVNSLTTNLPDLLIGKYFGPAYLGQYSLANRVLNLPIAILASSIQDVFRQKASDEYVQKKNCRASYIQFFILLMIVASIFIVPIIFIGPIIFPLILGDQWAEAGYLIQAIGILIVIKFISSPLSYVWIICGYQRLDFIWQLGLFFITFFSLSFGEITQLNLNIYSILLIYSLLVGAWYVVCIAISYRISKGKSSLISEKI